MSKPTTKQKWDRLAKTWTATVPPASPSTDDLSNYACLIRAGTLHLTSTPRLLVLGSTPNLRKLAEALAFDVTCVDISVNMYRECTKFLGAAPPKETFLEADWCSLDNCNLAFDVVIGDKVFDNIPPKLWDSFKRSMSVCVISGGVLITRAAPQNKSLVGRTFSSLLEYWAGQFESSAVDLPHAVSGLWEQALGASASLGNAPLNQCISYFEAEINALKRDQSLRKSARQVLNEFLTFFGLTTSDSWTSYSLGMLIDFLGEEFKLESIKYSSDYVAATRQPILMFRRQ